LLWARLDTVDLTTIVSFQRSGAHRHLHSFPTRRSSDLDELRQEGITGARQSVESVPWPGEEIVPADAATASDRARGTSTFGFTGDRKSTRLNSSHDQISYAVFCLKKKNKQIRSARPRHK